MSIRYDVTITRQYGDSVIASNTEYVDALQNVVTWLQSELQNGDATNVTDYSNGWHIHYSDHTDTLQVVPVYVPRDNEEILDAIAQIMRNKVSWVVTLETIEELLTESGRYPNA